MAEDSTAKSMKSIPSRFAPWYHIPDQLIVNVEHPCIIKNIDKGIGSLGGEAKVQKLLQDSNPSPVASLYLHPGNRNSKPTFSENVSTNNVVLKITVPKRTGRKRKRGTSGPFHGRIEESQTQPSLVSRDTRSLVRSLRDNVSKYEIQPVGFVHETHRFRNMLDFVTSTTGPDNHFMQKIRDDILPFEYEKLKKFKLDMSKGVKPNTELIAPPKWSHLSIPFNYSYKQNPAVKQHIDHHGNVTLISTGEVPRFFNQPVPHNIPEVPTAPNPDLPPIQSLELPLQRLIIGAYHLFEQRPIWTRRALHNNLSTVDWEKVGANSARYVYQYVGYMFGSGPWRDAIVKFGVDPRSDPSYRIYQVMMFMLENEPGDSRMNRLKETRSKKDRIAAARALIRNSHIFDGKNVSLDGKVWQICDITDPLLKTVLSNGGLRDICHIQGDGWYHNGTIAKAKIIMKYKIHSILTGQIPNDADFVDVIRQFPDIYNESTKPLAHLERGKATQLEFRIIGEMRTSAARSSYLKSAEKIAEVLGKPGEDAGDGAAVDPPLPEGSEMDSRVAHSLTEFDKLERPTDDQIPDQDIVEEMEVDGDDGSPGSMSVEEEDPDESSDGDGAGSSDDASGEEADVAEQDEEEEEKVSGDIDIDEDEDNMTGVEEAEEAEE